MSAPTQRDCPSKDGSADVLLHRCAALQALLVGSDASNHSSQDNDTCSALPVFLPHRSNPPQISPKMQCRVGRIWVLSATRGGVKSTSTKFTQFPSDDEDSGKKNRFRTAETCMLGHTLLCHSSVDALCALHDCALGISPVASYSGVKFGPHPKRAWRAAPTSASQSPQDFFCHISNK